MTTLTPAEVTALRTAMGLSQAHLADMLGINVRSVRAWESGKQGMSPSSSQAVRDLLAQHLDLTAAMLDADTPVAIIRDMPADQVPPRGWYLAAAGRAIATDPDLMVDWA